MEVVGAISSPLHRESAKRLPSPPPLFGADEAAGLSGWPSPPQGELLYRVPAQGVILPVVVPGFHWRHVLAAARRVRGAAAIAAVIIWRRCSRRTLRVALPPSGRGSLQRCCMGSSSPHRWYLSLWLPPPCCCTGVHQTSVITAAINWRR